MSISWKKYRKSIPHKFKVSSKRSFEIVFISEFSDPLVLGETRFDPPQIVIRSNLTDKETVMTFWHEMLHAISDEHSIALTEQQVVKLEKSLPSLIKLLNEFKK